MEKWESPAEKEKRRAILRKAEFEINLAEREVHEWKMHRRESPISAEPPTKDLKIYRRETPISDSSNKSHTTLSDIICKTPTSFSRIGDLSNISPNIKQIEKRLRDIEEVRKIENENHRKEIERLEHMIDQMQENRKVDPKFEALQREYEEKVRELEKKNKEIAMLKARKGEEKSKNSFDSRCNSQDFLQKEKKNRLRSAKTNQAGNVHRDADREAAYWKEKAFEMSTKYLVAMKTMRNDLTKLKEDCNNEWKQFRRAYQDIINLRVKK